MPEPSVAAVALDYGGAAAVAPQPPAAGQPAAPTKRGPRLSEADWAPAVGRRCEARHTASSCKPVNVPRTHWFSGVITAVDVDARTCDVKYDDGDFESAVRFQYVRAPPLVLLETCRFRGASAATTPT